MSIWNKILIGFIIVAALTFFYLAARTLKTHQHWRQLAGKLQEQVETLQEENHKLIHDDPEEQEADAQGNDLQPGIKRLRLELYKLLVDRGRAWYNCTPEQVDRQTGQVAVKTDFPDPHGIADKSILYVFEEKDIEDKDDPAKGQYLGEFKVTGVAERQVVLQPIQKQTAEQLTRLANSTGTWRLYDIMPIDVRSVFSTLSEEDKQKILPAGSVKDYTKDGKAAEKDDPEGRVVDGKYVRLLRDYQKLFHAYHLQRVLLADQFIVTAKDFQYIDATRKDAMEQQKFRENELAQLKAEMAKVSRERDAVRGLYQVLQPRVLGLQQSIAQIAASNRAAAARIAQIQAEATRRINSQTGVVARTEGN
jgi:hypothetical protein